MTKKVEEAVEQPSEPQEATKKKRTMPVRVELLELEDDFEGWRFYANRNFTFGELEDLLSFNYRRMVTTLKRVVTDWDNFVDRDGNPISFIPSDELPAEGETPDPKKPDPWRELTSDLLVAMTRAVVGLPSVPNK